MEFREVFVTAKAPRRPLSPSAVVGVVGYACDRAVMERAGPHRLRHTLASDLLRAGTPLAQIAPYWAQRLSIVRQFARHLQTIDPACEVPPAQLLPYRAPRAIPYLYEPEEIRALMRAAGELEPPLLAANYQTLIGLLAVTGIRLGEAIRLNRDDVDVRHKLLRVLDSKFGKSREIVLHDSTMRALREYARLRDRRFPQPRCEAFLVSLRGTRLRKNCIHHMFARLVQVAGLTPRSPRCRPRPHDLRHAFAVGTLLEWYRDGVDVQARLPLLSTYMGHVNPASTFYYLTAAPELLALVASRLDSTMDRLAEHAPGPNA